VKNVLKFVSKDSLTDQAHYYTSSQITPDDARAQGLRVARKEVVIGSFNTLILQEERDAWGDLGKWVVTFPSLRWKLNTESRQAGVFANEDIPEGSIVTEYGGKVVTAAEMKAYQELRRLDPESAEEWGRHIRVLTDGGTAQALSSVTSFPFLACTCVLTALSLILRARPPDAHFRL